MKIRAILLSALLSASICGVAVNADAAEVKVGASPTPHAEILKAAIPLMKAKGHELKIIEYADYVQPNMALDAGELDANYFQHQPYLTDFNKEKGTKLVSIASVHYEPFGIYAGKTKSLKDLKKKAIVAVPNDTTNEARALLLLQDLKLRSEEIEAAQLVRSLPDVDIAPINGNYAILGGLKVKDALAAESADSIAATTYANILTVRVGDENRQELKDLADILKGEEIKAFINKTYDGAVVPSK